MSEPRKRRRWASYSLRSLFVLVTLAALASVWIGGAMRQERAVAAIRKIPGRAAYDFEVAPRARGTMPVSWVPQRILDRVGKDYFHNVVEVDLGRSLDRLKIHQEVTDDMAHMLAGLPRLGKLSLLVEDMSDEGLAEMAKLRHLKSLSLDYVGLRSRVTAGGLTFLARLSQLESLSVDLRYSQVTDEWMAALEPLHNLERLELDGSCVTAAGLAHLSDLPNLKTLSLVNIACGDDGIACVARLTGLERLRLFGATLTDAGLAKLAALSNLKDLRVAFTAVTDAALSDLLRLQNLETLDVQGTRMTAAGLAQLAALPRLKQLDVSVPPDDLLLLRAALPGCDVTNMH